MTDEQFIRWLKNSTAIRCVLVEVNVKTEGGEVTRFLSNKGYVTSPTDSPANTVYKPYVVGAIKFTETLPLEANSASLSFGDIEIDNMSGDRDSWLNDIWTNRTIKVFIGDVSWPRNEFRQIFKGVVVGIDTKNRSRLNIKISDNLQRLNTPVTENKIGGTLENKDELIPLCFGECHNVEPVLIDPTVNEYQVHDGPIERIIEVRDNGVPVEFIPLLSLGKFRLAGTPVGTVTVSVQGDKPSAYYNDITTLVKRLVKDFGVEDKRFTDADLDMASFNSFSAAHRQPVGLYMKSRTNVLEAVSQAVSSVGGRLVVRRSGKLALIKLDLPRRESGTLVQPKDIVLHSLAVSQMPNVYAGVKIGYARNWLKQDTVAAGVISEHAEMYKEEWLTVTQTNSLTAQDYKMFSEPTMQQTLLLTAADAMAEASRRLAICSVQRKVYKYTGLPHLMLEELGESQTIKNDRFELENGATGQIISLQTDWLNPHITVEVLV